MITKYAANGLYKITVSLYHSYQTYLGRKPQTDIANSKGATRHMEYVSINVNI